MSVGQGRVRRPDDWPSSHVRARAGLSDRLDRSLDPTEEGWLTAHLSACPECRSIETAYRAQSSELRELRGQRPQPPRDLWARTAAALESESRFRDGRARRGTRSRRALLAPYALLSAALVVAVIVGTLTSSQRFGGDGAAGPSAATALGSLAASGRPDLPNPGATPIAVAQRVEWLSRESDGAYQVQVANVAEVCPPESIEPCDTAAPVENRSVEVNRGATSVFGSPDGDRLIVYNNRTARDNGTVSVVSLQTDTVGGPTPSPSTTSSAGPPPTPSPTPTPRATSSAAPTPSAPTASPSPTISPTSSPPATASVPPSAETPTGSPPPSVEVSPSPSGDRIVIARDVALVGQTAAYSASGRMFAFTARPVEGSLGPDIYLWRVGDDMAAPITTDHRSMFGSWSGDIIIGSTVVEIAPGVGQAAPELVPESFLLDPGSRAIVALPQTGRAWRPSLDPMGQRAVYWAGTLRATNGPGFAPDAGRLVLGSWDTGKSAPTEGPLPTALSGDQATARHETTIVAGRMDDWDARWDETGTHLAVWIADNQNPALGRLSLYDVNPFDGRIELKTPLLDAQLATAGYAISDGQLVWAEPAADGSTTGGKIQVLAWTDQGSGRVESVPGPVIVIR